MRFMIRRASLALSLLPSLAVAQPDERGVRGDAGAPIVITGERVTREQARSRAADFVRRIGIARGDISTARLVDPVCVRVLGLADAYAAMVANRMRAIAQAAGARMGRSGCEPNVTVSFVGDAGALVRDVIRRSPTRFDALPADARSVLVGDDAPIRWWYRTDTRSRYNIDRSYSPQAFAAGTFDAHTQGGGSPLPQTVPSLNHYDSSMISTQANRVIVNAYVVIDLDAVEGRPLMAVAAYAAFVALSEVHPSAPPPPAGSILGMFGAERVAALTEWDTAFLRSLYNLPLDRNARRQRGMLIRDMVAFQTRG